MQATARAATTERRIHLVLVALLAHAVGCGGDDTAEPDGGVDDASTIDEGPRRGDGAVSESGEDFGAPCERDSDCRGDLFCDREVEVSVDIPGRSDVRADAFPGGVCTPVPAAPYDPTGVDSCDPLLPQGQQGCGENGRCIAVSVEGQTVVACRPLCDPAADDNACGRDDYACDFTLGACMEGCLSDDECRLRVSADEDGNVDVAYDSDSDAYCDQETFRCTHDGSSFGDLGEECERRDDCDPDGVCLQTLGGMGFPDGSCSKFGCAVDGRECDGDDAVCEPLRTWQEGSSTTPACLARCQVGEEEEEDRVGSDGHGAGCRAGYRCHYNGGGDNDGVCVGGAYNDIEENNLGDACDATSECYSPFGLGQCLSLSVGAAVAAPTGVCTLFDCAVPGLPEDVCGAGSECIGLNPDGDLSFCIRNCKDASECPDGFACADDDGDPTTTTVCYPACFEDSECREGSEVCDLQPSGVGSCAPM